MKLSFKLILHLIIICTFLNSCTLLKNRGQFQMDNGSYKIKDNHKKATCFILNESDTLKLKSGSTITNYPTKLVGDSSIKIKLNKTSFDLDILTVLVKYRPAQSNYLIPAQLSTNLNGNLYGGFRNDIYKINYKINHFGFSERKINHFGFSGGLFVGFGNTLINSNTTNKTFTNEYDGIVLQKGLTGIIAIDNVSIGLSIGTDHLLDRNRSIWIYQNKPWFGLMLGLNLN